MSPLQTMGLVGALLAAGLAVYYLGVAREEAEQLRESLHIGCLLYTSDAADD